MDGGARGDHAVSHRTVPGLGGGPLLRGRTRARTPDGRARECLRGGDGWAPRATEPLPQSPARKKPRDVRHRLPHRQHQRPDPRRPRGALEPPLLRRDRDRLGRDPRIPPRSRALVALRQQLAAVALHRRPPRDRRVRQHRRDPRRLQRRLGRLRRRPGRRPRRDRRLRGEAAPLGRLRPRPVDRPPQRPGAPRGPARAPDGRLRQGRRPRRVRRRRALRPRDDRRGGSRGRRRRAGERDPPRARDRAAHPPAPRGARAVESGRRRRLGREVVPPGPCRPAGGTRVDPSGFSAARCPAPRGARPGARRAPPSRGRGGARQGR